MNNDIPETKFNVKIYQKDKGLRVAKSAKEALKGVVSKKKISILQKDTIHCPVLDSERSFVECFACESFILPANALALNPEKITVKTAPILAADKIAI